MVRQLVLVQPFGGSNPSTLVLLFRGQNSLPWFLKIVRKCNESRPVKPSMIVKRKITDHCTKAQSELASVFYKNGKGLANEPPLHFVSKCMLLKIGL